MAYNNFKKSNFTKNFDRKLSAIFCIIALCVCVIMLKGNVTRWCFENGTWQSKPDYSQCLDWPEVQSVKYACFSIGHACSVPKSEPLVLNLFITPEKM